MPSDAQKAAKGRKPVSTDVQGDGLTGGAASAYPGDSSAAKGQEWSHREAAIQRYWRDVPTARFGPAVDIARDFVSGWTAMLDDGAVNEWARQLHAELEEALNYEPEYRLED